jgi:hypothetical protein
MQARDPNSGRVRPAHTLRESAAISGLLPPQRRPVDVQLDRYLAA